MNDDEKIGSIRINTVTNQVTVLTKKEEADHYAGIGFIMFAFLFIWVVGFLSFIPLLVYLVTSKSWKLLALFATLFWVYALFVPDYFFSHWFENLFVVSNIFSCILIFYSLISQSRTWWIRCIWIYLFLSIFIYGISSLDSVVSRSDNMIFESAYLLVKMLFFPLSIFLHFINELFGFPLFPSDFFGGWVNGKKMSSYFFIPSASSASKEYINFIKSILPFAWLSMWVAVIFYTIQVRNWWKKLGTKQQ